MNHGLFKADARGVTLLAMIELNPVLTPSILRIILHALLHRVMRLTKLVARNTASNVVPYIGALIIFSD